jgi:hypothetical protein
MLKSSISILIIFALYKKRFSYWDPSKQSKPKSMQQDKNANIHDGEHGEEREGMEEARNHRHGELREKH